MHGHDGLLKAARQLVFGVGQVAQLNDSIASVQTVSGSGANSLAARFVGRHLESKNVWFPNPTWDNHFHIWKENAPSIRQRLYPYYDSSRSALDFDGMLNTLQRDAEIGDTVILHACAHNPTGLDPSQEQWQHIAQVCRQLDLFVIFDSAYQGFASGDLDEDAWSIRHFAERGDITLAVCQSFSKNLGLYGERVGVLHIMAPRPIATTALMSIVRSRMIELQRGDVSMPPRFGAQVASCVLNNTNLYALWRKDLEIMSGRIKSMRMDLYNELVKLKTPGSWSHIVQQTGMFSYTGLTKDQVLRLRTQYHIYMLDSGRASICGLRSANVKYVAKAIHGVVLEEQSAK